jgi:hypothetical protein
MGTAIVEEGQYEDELAVVAYHEAGHAVMAIACGFCLVNFSIEKSASSKGFVEFLAPAPTTSEIAKKQALVSAAGLAADMLLATKTGRQRPNDTFYGHFGDQESCRRSILESNSTAEFDDYLTTSMLFLRKNWKHVEAFAKILYAMKTFNANAIDVARFPKLPAEWETWIEVAKESRLKEGEASV